MKLLNLISQISLQGFDKAAESSVISSMLVAIVLALVGVVVILFKKFESKVKENAQIREQALLREEARNKEILESEKETLKVLNGVTAILDLNDRISQQDTANIIKTVTNESEKIQRRIEEIQKTIDEVERVVDKNYKK